MTDLLRIDINADLGEKHSTNHAYIDDKLMPLISSCNIAVGGHFGTNETMQITCGLAAKHGVKIGAHIAYEDRVNFGRKSLNISKLALFSQLDKQLDNFEDLCLTMELDIHHIKPHGALYHDICMNKDLAEAFCDYLINRSFNGMLYGLSGSVIESIAATKGIRFWNEIFADRAYTTAGTLKPRSQEGSVLINSEGVAKQLQHWTKYQKMPVQSGYSKTLTAQTICVHSDTTDALSILKVTRKTLKSNGYHIV